MIELPAFLNDAHEVLTPQGFTCTNTWYHGTSSALIESIQSQGLKRSGDQALREAAKKTMATIGDRLSEHPEPVFLTPSKALAYYWALQTVQNRKLRFHGDEAPVVLAVTLTDDINAAVKPDVGAASLLLLQEGEQYLAYLVGLYQEQGLTPPEIDLMKAQRMDYLNRLGMAYIDQDIPANCIQPLT